MPDIKLKEERMGERTEIPGNIKNTSNSSLNDGMVGGDRGSTSHKQLNDEYPPVTGVPKKPADGGTVYCNAESLEHGLHNGDQARPRGRASECPQQGSQLRNGLSVLHAPTKIAH